MYQIYKATLKQTKKEVGIFKLPLLSWLPKIRNRNKEKENCAEINRVISNRKILKKYLFLVCLGGEGYFYVVE